MIPKIQTQKERLLFILGGILLFFFTWGFLWPKINKIWEGKNVLDQEKGRVEKLKIKLGELQGLNEAELSQRAQLSLRAVPAEKNFLEVLGNLNMLAASSGVILESFQISPGGLSVAEKGKLDFKVSLVGTREGIENFLAAVDKTFPLISVNQVKIGGEKEVGETELSLETYFLPLPKTLGVLETPIPKLTTDEEKTLKTLSSFTSFPSATFEAPVPSAGGRANPFVF